MLKEFSFHSTNKENIFSSKNFFSTFTFVNSFKGTRNESKVSKGGLRVQQKRRHFLASILSQYFFYSNFTIFLKLRFADCLFRLLLVFLAFFPKKEKFNFFFSLILCMRVSLASFWFDSKWNRNWAEQKHVYLDLWSYSSVFNLFRLLPMLLDAECSKLKINLILIVFLLVYASHLSVSRHDKSSEKSEALNRCLFGEEFNR